MTSRKLNFDEETKQFIAIYTNIKGEEIEKVFTRRTGPCLHGFGPQRRQCFYSSCSSVSGMPLEN